MVASSRYRVIIRCPKCGEKYILRGRLDQKGELETGFKQCVCGNESTLHIDISPE
ncbi:hypothetical protein [Bacillus piscicola]|uniref:hypothetical protein n=1 Tax=Bacillus piscicola TaxID=1632684 RepID=UPI001F08C45F|nr:hypothetical protein [Bacillus piscicola]